MIHDPIKNARVEARLIQSRISVIVAIVGILSLVLIVRLWFLQVHNFERFSALSEDNRVSILPIAPDRGEVRDRAGRLLADNISIYTLQAQRVSSVKFEETLNRLTQFIPFTPWELKKARLAFRESAQYEFFMLKFGLTDEEAAKFAVNQHLFPDISIQAVLQRHYPYAGELAHVLGYVGRISQRDLTRVDKAKYRGVNYIGRTGIEASYEQELLGVLGFEQVEQNAHGRTIRVLDRQTPVHGKNLQLHLDIELQKAAREALGEYRGSVVAIEPATGGVLALASNPVYDPNQFVNGIDHESYSQLRDDINRPLLNRSIYGRYAPGSTIKPLFALAGFKNGFHRNKRVFCPGWFSLPGNSHRYRCWNHSGHGYVNYASAIIQSCDVFFYKLADTLGIDKLSSFMSRFGLGRKTGIDLESEPTGLMPSSEWKRRVHKTVWYPGETVITGIGQGYMLTTPVQLAAITATLANRGERKTPKLVKQIADQLHNESEPSFIEPDLVSDNSDEEYERVINTMRDVIHGEKGTARGIRYGLKYDIAGKTGTAQVVGIAQGEKYDETKLDEFKRDHSLFIGFAPVNNPKIALAVVVENAGSGGKVAAPIARKVFDKYLLDILADNLDRKE